MAPKKNAHPLTAAQLTLLLFLFRIPFLLYYYPGCMPGDTWTSVEQWTGLRDFTAELAGAGPDIVFTNHIPFFNTILCGLAYELGQFVGVTGLGYAFISVVLSGLFCYAIAQILCYLRSHGAGSALIWSMTAVYALLPYYSLWSMELLRDGLMSLAVLGITYQLLRLTDTPILMKSREGLSARISLSLLLLLLMLSKNQCPYLVVLLGVALWTYFRGARWHVAAVVGAPLVLYYGIWTALILPTCNVAPVGRQESMGFMFQQTARYVVEHPEDMTLAERDAIDAVLPFDSLGSLYNEDLQDPVKFRYRSTCTSEEIQAYLLTWLKLGVRHPACYLAATWEGCDAYFIPGLMVQEGEEKVLPPLASAGELPRADSSLYVRPLHGGGRTNFSFVQHLPIIGWLLNLGTLMLCFGGLILWALLRRRTDILLLMTLCILQTFVLLLSPADGCYRYIMPMVWSLPIYLILLMRSRKSKKKV